MTIENISETQTFYLPDPVSPRKYLEQLSNLQEKGYRIYEILFDTEKVNKRVAKKKKDVVHLIRKPIELEKGYKVASNRMDTNYYALIKNDKMFLLLFDSELTQGGIFNFSARVYPKDKLEFSKFTQRVANIETKLGDTRALGDFLQYLNDAPKLIYSFSHGDVANPPVAKLEFYSLKDNAVSDFLPDQNPRN